MIALTIKILDLEPLSWYVLFQMDDVYQQTLQFLSLLLSWKQFLLKNWSCSFSWLNTTGVLFQSRHDANYWHFSSKIWSLFTNTLFLIEGATLYLQTLNLSIRKDRRSEQKLSRSKPKCNHHLVSCF